MHVSHAQCVAAATTDDDCTFSFPVDDRILGDPRGTAPLRDYLSLAALRICGKIIPRYDIKQKKLYDLFARLLKIRIQVYKPRFLKMHEKITMKENVDI